MLGTTIPLGTRKRVVCIILCIRVVRCEKNFPMRFVPFTSTQSYTSDRRKQMREFAPGATQRAEDKEARYLHEYVESDRRNFRFFVSRTGSAIRGTRTKLPHLFMAQRFASVYRRVARFVSQLNELAAGAPVKREKE